MMKPVNMFSAFYIPVRMTLLHFAISMLFVLSCGTASYYNRPEDNDRLENIKILNNLIGIDTLICRSIDLSIDTIILHKGNYSYFSLDTKSSIDECAKKKGFKVTTYAHEIYFANPIRPKDHEPFFEFISIGNPEDGAKFIKIVVKRGRLRGNEHEMKYSLKSIDGKYYIDKFIEGIIYQ